MPPAKAGAALAAGRREPDRWGRINRHWLATCEGSRRAPGWLRALIRRRQLSLPQLCDRRSGSPITNSGWTAALKLETSSEVCCARTLMRWQSLASLTDVKTCHAGTWRSAACRPRAVPDAIIPLRTLRGRYAGHCGVFCSGVGSDDQRRRHLVAPTCSPFACRASGCGRTQLVRILRRSAGTASPH